MKIATQGACTSMPSSASMTSLLAKIRACNQCQAHLPLAAKPILQASRQARILIAGQAPGIKTHDKGIPFDDASGERLRSWLNVTREQFYNPALLPSFLWDFVSLAVLKETVRSKEINHPAPNAPPLGILNY